MLIKVLVLGRPGSGKTTAIHELRNIARHRAYLALSLDDYDILSRMSQEDTLHEKFRSTEHGGFDVLDHSVFDTALETLEKQVQAALRTEKDGIIMIEFARNDYRQALRRFSPSFLQDAYIFFVEADLHTCIQRIHERTTKPTPLRAHFVSNYIMQTYYSQDNWTYVTNHLKTEYNIYKTVETFYNTGSLACLIERVNEFAEQLFAQEFRSRNYTQTNLVITGNSALSRVLSR